MAAPEESQDVGSFRDLLTYVQGALASDDVDDVDLDERLQAAQPQFLTLLQHRVRAHMGCAPALSAVVHLTQAQPCLPRLLGASVCHITTQTEHLSASMVILTLPECPSPITQCQICPETLRA